MGEYLTVSNFCCLSTSFVSDHCCIRRFVIREYSREKKLFIISDLCENVFCLDDVYVWGRNKRDENKEINL